MTSPETPSQPVAWLIAGGRPFGIEADRICVVGSGEKASIRIVHRSVGTAHALVSAHDGRFQVEDLGSEGGTFVGSVRILGTCEVPDGATVRFGDIDVRVTTTPPPGVTAEAAAPAEQQNDDEQPLDPAAAAAAFEALAATQLPTTPAPVPLPVGAANQHAAAEPAHEHKPLSQSHQGPAFHELMADELRRAPWFLLSATLHALLFLILFLLIPPPDIGSRKQTVFGMSNSDLPEEFGELETRPDETFEVEEIKDTEQDLQEIAEQEIDSLTAEPEQVQEFVADYAEPDPFGGGAAYLEQISSGFQGDILKAGGTKGRRLSSGFRRTVAGLRESGLEIMFVFDSTGSMGPVLSATRKRMTRMLEALRSLVPDARVGIVTYRDHGRYEDYLTRSVPLGQEFFRTMSFMQTVQAGGGGDRPEAVYDALQEALGQRWSSDSKRVVVLIGDAPAHPQTMGRLTNLLRTFTRQGNATVHAIMTTPDFFGKIQGDTKESFEKIAQAGRGLCLPFEREDKVLEQVMALAIGNEHRDAVSAVFEILDEESEKKAADKTPIDLENLDRDLLSPRVDRDFMERLAESKDRDTAEKLIDLLQRREYPGWARHAASWAVTRMLQLSQPPIDPAEDGQNPIDRRTAEQLRQSANRLPPRGRRR